MPVVQNETDLLQDIFLKATQVRARYGGCSHMWIERRQKDAGFPAATYFGGLRFWKLSELENWDAGQKAKPRARAVRRFNMARS